MRHSRHALVVACFGAIAISAASGAETLSRGIGRSAPTTEPAAARPEPAAPHGRIVPGAQCSDFVDANPYPGGLELGYSDFGPLTGIGAELGYNDFGPVTAPYPSGIYIGPVWASGYRHHWHAPSNTIWNGSLSAGVANSIDGVPMGPMNTPSITGGPRHKAIAGIPNAPRRFTRSSPPRRSRLTANPPKH